MASQHTIDLLLQRFGGATTELLDSVLAPHRLRITKIDVVTKGRSTTATFVADVPAHEGTIFEEGTTGKVVPRNHVESKAPWRELIKGRILKSESDRIEGELYFDSGRFKTALAVVAIGDYLEVDPFGVTSKVESALCEAALYKKAKYLGFTVTRMPENVAKHIGTQNYYDFKLEKDGKVYRVELKSLWGTDTTKARLIHTVTKASGTGKNSAREDRQTWSTSSCRFKDQDIFAVGLWLRTGQIVDFAFALSVSDDEQTQWGLPKVPDHPAHVTQNPPISDPPKGAWNMDLLTACQRVDAWKAQQAQKTKT